MDAHENARTTPHGRMLMVERLRRLEGQPVAAATGVYPATVRKWRDRFAAEGAAGLRDRSSRPHHSPARLPPETAAGIEALRRQRRSGPAIARQLGLPGSTVGLVLRRLGLGRLAALDPKPAIIRYERERPGELIHIDTKKLGRIDGVGHRITGDRRGQSSKRGTGWEYLHVAVDDASRLAYTAVLPDERKESAVAFLNRALAWFAAHGVTVERVMTDNGSAFEASSSPAPSPTTACGTSAPGPTRRAPTARPSASSRPRCASGPTPRPSTPRPNGPRAMHPWLHAYNTTRPHAALNGKPPVKPHRQGQRPWQRHLERFLTRGIAERALSDAGRCDS